MSTGDAHFVLRRLGLSAAGIAPMDRRRHAAAFVAIAIVATVTMRGWLFRDRLPAADFAGYAEELQYVRDAVLELGRVPAWNQKWSGGSTDFLSRFKEYVGFPAAVLLGPIWGLKVTIWVVRILAGF